MQAPLLRLLPALWRWRLVSQNSSGEAHLQCVGCVACVQARVLQARVPQHAVELLYAGALFADAEWRVPALAKALVPQ